MSLEIDPTSYKFAVILNRKLDAGIAMNATAHMVASLMMKAGDSEKENMEFLDYLDADG